MLNISMKSMLEAGVHFGHQTYRWNPKMSRYIFGERNGIHILDLQKTVKEIKKAYTFVKDSAKAGKTFLFVGTKKQAKEIIREEATRAEVSCVHEKWLGGTLTNFETLRKSLKRLEELEKFENDGLFKVMSKKEVSRLSKEKARLVKLLSGIRNLRGLPDIMFIVDPVNEANALKEAHKLKIPVVGVCDTNCDPDQLDWPIPGNDDAARSIRLFCATMADAVIDGRAEAEAEKAAAHQQAQADAAVEAGEQQGEAAPEYAPEQQEAPAEEPVRTEE
ncbi:MAG: 30S ribosomal protein S2 [Elusimicrobia bacterium GWC2_63_65]|nr:MAG: 30S ribosomal protein S2 [Elusimicrobia bacterium GWC2_63_65]